MAEGTILHRKEKKGEGEEVSGVDKDAWMVTFSDLLQLLITFFVLLISMASMDQKILKEMFQIFDSGVGHLNTTGGSRIIPPTMVKNIMPAMIRMEEFIKLLDMKPSIPVEEEVRDIMSKILVNNVEVIKKGDGFAMILSDEALFEPGQVEIKPELKPVLDHIGKILSLSLNQIVIEGHTDDTPSHGRVLHSNWELSAARASSVLKYFLETGVISQERIKAKGFASHHPKVKNFGEKYRKRNRRIEIVIKQFEEKAF